MAGHLYEDCDGSVELFDEQTGWLSSDMLAPILEAVDEAEEAMTAMVECGRVSADVTIAAAMLQQLGHVFRPLLDTSLTNPPYDHACTTGKRFHARKEKRKGKKLHSQTRGCANAWPGTKTSTERIV